MKSTGCAMIFLLFFIVLAVSRCEEPPPLPSNTSGVRLYLPFQSRELQTYSIISAEMFYDKDHSTEDRSSDGIIDALWCQSSDLEAVGTWYFPNDTEVPTFDEEFGNDSAPRPLFAKNFDGQVALARREGLSGYEGLYKCVIPDENEVNQTLVVGIYRTKFYKANEGPRLSAVTYNLISVVPLHASLNFNVTKSPPTYLNCTVNGSISLSISRTILDGPNSITGASVAVRERYAGNYRFIVSNDRVTDSIANKLVTAHDASTDLTIGVAEAPTGLAAMLTGSTTVQVSWSHSGTPYRYEVFQVNNNRTQSVFNTSTGSNASIKGLTPGENYTFFVVAISLDTSTILLPSEHSVPVSISVPSNKTSTSTSSSTIMRSSMTPTPSLVSSSSQLLTSMPPSTSQFPSRPPSISQFPSTSLQPSVVRPTPGNIGDPEVSSVGLTVGIVALSLLSFILIALIVVLIGMIVAISKTNPKKKQNETQNTNT